MKNYRKYTAAFLAVGLSLAALGCSPVSEDEPIYDDSGSEEICEEAGEMDEKNQLYFSLEDAVELSDIIVRAEVEQITEEENYKDIVFKVNEHIKGADSEELIVVRYEQYDAHIEEDISYTAGLNEYTEDHEYVLVLERYESVYEESDIYFIMEDIYIPVEEEIEIMIHGAELNLDITAIDEKIDYIEEVAERYETEQVKEVIGIPYTRSQDIEIIVEEATNIYEIQVGELVVNGVGNTDTYACKIKKEYKGIPNYFDIIDRADDLNEDVIYIIFLKDSVTVGKEYLVMLNSQPDSMIYTLSSKNSVHAVSYAKDIADLL